MIRAPLRRPEPMRFPILVLTLLLSACGGAPPPAAVAPANPPAAESTTRAPPAPVVSETGDAAQSRALLNAYLAAWNGHDADKAASFLGDNVTMFDSLLGNVQHGRAEARDNVIGMYLRAVPDGRWTLRGEPVLSGDGFAYEWSLTGINLGNWTSYLHGRGQTLDFKGISIVRIKDGKIVYQANYFDTEALGQQTGW